MARTLLHCHASPARNGWLRSDSEQNRVASPPWVLFLTSLHPACSRRLGRFFIVTPRLLTTPGFPTTQGKSGRAMPALGFALRFGPSELFATARTLLIIPFPLLHFNWECGIYKGIWDISGIFLTVLNGKIACLPWSERGGRRLKAALLGVACSPGSGP